MCMYLSLHYVDYLNLIFPLFLTYLVNSNPFWLVFCLGLVVLFLSFRKVLINCPILVILLAALKAQFQLDQFVGFYN